MKFFVTALLFMLFDLEVVTPSRGRSFTGFLSRQVAIFGPILFFIGVLVLGLFYEIKKGALEWRSEPARRSEAIDPPCGSIKIIARSRVIDLRSVDLEGALAGARRGSRSPNFPT